MTSLGVVVAATVLLCASQYTLAGDLECGVDRRTDAYHCFNKKQLRETAGIRWAPLYTGGPKGVRSTSYTVHANCRTQVMHLKDRDGVSFGGGVFSDTPLATELGNAICAAPLPATKTR